MQRLTVYPSSINHRHIDMAVEAISSGEIVIYPTDSLYALGCDALSQRAVERLCAIIGINPARQLLSIVCADLSMASQYARIDNHAFRILKRNTPGPFTFIMPAATTLPKAFKGRRTVGIRIPDNAIAQALAQTFNGPILSASVTSKDEEETPISADDIELLPQLSAEILIDGGKVAGNPTTVVDLTDSTSPVIIRQGRAELS